MLNQTELFESGSWKAQVRGVNSDYSFVLGRDSETKPWVINEVNKRASKSLEVWNDRKTLLADLVLAPRTPILPKVFQSPGFKLVSVTPELLNGKELARLTFTCSPEGNNRLRGGWVDLDPSTYWVIRRGEVDIDFGNKEKHTAKWIAAYDYKEGSNGHPIMTRSMLKGKTWEGGRIVGEDEYLANDDLKERASIPESEFTLGAYGLPEPMGASSQPRTRWYIWSGLAGVICIIAGVLLWRRRIGVGLSQTS